MIKKFESVWKSVAALFLVALLAVAFPLSINKIEATGQAPPLEWEKKFGTYYYDSGYSVQQTSDGGYIVVGETYFNTAGDRDVWLIKTDSNGNKLWDKTFGGADRDCGYSVQQTSDGGYIIAGGTGYCPPSYCAVLLIKTDSNGNKLWDKEFNGANIECGYSVQETSDEGYIIVGETRSYGAGDFDVWLIKTDSDGNKVWDKTFGGEECDYGHSVQQTSDGGYIIAGLTYSYTSPYCAVWLIKTDSDGNKLWDSIFIGRNYDYGECVQQTSDGGYIIAGGTLLYETDDTDVWLIKTDSDGNKLWDKAFGGAERDYGHSVQQTSDGGYIIAGETASYGADGSDFWLIKTDLNGNKLWDETFGDGAYDYGRSVQQTSDGGYIIAGTLSCGIACTCDIWLLKVGSEVGPEWDPWAYDENSDGEIQKCEAIQAVQDYFDGTISKEQAIEVVMLYFG